MSIVWAICAALAWGVADFLARVASDQVGSRSTVFFGQLCSSFLLVFVLVVTEPEGAMAWSRTAAAYALVSGVLNAVGLTVFYEALRRGPVSLVAPIASSFGGVTALLAWLAGERGGAWQVAGLGAIVLGIVGSTTTFEASSPNAMKAPRGGVPLAIVVAITWGGAFFLLTPAFAAFGSLVPILTCRVVTVVGHAAYAVGGRKPWSWKWSAAPAVVGTAVLDTVAFVAYGASVQSGMTSVSVVVASLFSTVTVLLAAVLLRERLRRTQWMAVALLLVGIALVAQS